MEVKTLHGWNTALGFENHAGPVFAKETIAVETFCRKYSKFHTKF